MFFSMVSVLDVMMLTAKSEIEDRGYKPDVHSVLANIIYVCGSVRGMLLESRFCGDDRNVYFQHRFSNEEHNKKTKNRQED